MRLVRTWRYCHEARSESGAANVEYALLLVLIAVFCIVSVSYFGLMLKDYLLDAGDNL